MRPSVPTLWSFNGGYVDTAGFLALHGLFTSHVTGNFVTFGAAIAQGTSGVATGQQGEEGSILRYVFFHSLALAVLVGILVFLQAYVFPGMIPTVAP